MKTWLWMHIILLRQKKDQNGMNLANIEGLDTIKYYLQLNNFS